MEAELARLATSGATTVVALMASDAWNAMRSRIVALVRRGSATQEEADRAEAEMDSERLEATAVRDSGDPTVVADLEAVWRVRLRQLLREDPSASVALRELIAEGTAAPGAVHNSISGGEFRQAVIQAGNIQGGIHLG
ncbi:hypothetical protein [Streptomyces sp. NPDC008139]|uniref:hypothetical protein n=1 Tax=Streptomyces sp. NPDC008139 TaxID=3364814 RepID=UPI0036ECEB22